MTPVRHPLLVSLLAALSALPAAPSALAAEPSVVSAVTSPSLIAGAEPGDRLGTAADLGDFDGDGLDDLLTTQHGYYGEFSSYEQGTAYIVLGRGDDEPVDLAAPLGQRGIAIRFPAGWESSTATAAGDVNGDGRGDVAVSASRADVSGQSEAGRIFVIFGRSGTAPIDLTALGSGGFEIRGSGSGRLANHVASVPDVNGDGRDELFVEEAYPDRYSIVFGKTTTTAVNLASLGANGYHIVGSEYLRYPASLGDVNGDGRGDVAIVRHCEWPCVDHDVAIVFGKATNAAVDVTQLGAGGFLIRFRHNAWPSYVGDVDGDGRDDIGVRSSYTGPRGEYFDDSYIVFGRAATSALDLYALGDGGFAIRGGGYPLEGVGDVDGDGRDDVALSYSAGGGGGATAVLFGKSDPSPLDPAALLDDGFLLASTWAEGATSTTTFGAGPRIALSFPYDDPLGRREAGSVRLVAPPPPHFALPTARAYVAGGAIEPIEPTDVRRASPLAFTVSPALPAGLHLDPATGTISGTPAQATPAAVYTVEATDRLGTTSRAISLRIDGDAYATTAPGDGAVVGELPTLVWQRASALDDSEPVGAYSVVLDGTVLATVPADACGAATCSLTVPAALADGPHRWHVEATARDGRTRRTPSVSLTVVAPPTARLALSAPALHTGAPLRLDASDSRDVNGDIVRFAFDLDGDGSFESDSASRSGRRASRPRASAASACASPTPAAARARRSRPSASRRRRRPASPGSRSTTARSRPTTRT